MIVLGIAAKTVFAAAPPACPVVKSQDEARLISYVVKKYGIPETVKVSLKETSVVSDDCHRKLLFAGNGPLGTFTLPLYASPDLRFLSPDIFDSYSDPAAEQKEKARKLMGDLVDGDFASKGVPNAPVTVVVFSDFQCPYCQRTAALLKDDSFIQSGKDVRLVFRHFPLPQHNWAQQAALGAACAEFQNATAFWAFHDSLFAEQNSITADNITAKIKTIASGIPSLDQSSFATCVNRQISLGVVLSDKALASKIGVAGTPTIFINGQLANGVNDASQLHEQLSKRILESRSKSAMLEK